MGRAVRMMDCKGSLHAVLQYNGYDIKSEPLGFLPEPIDHSGQAKGGAMVFSFTTQVDAV